MCTAPDIDVGDVIHAVANPIDYGLSKIGLGSPIPGLVKDKLGLNGQGVPSLPPLETSPPPQDLSDELVQRAAIARRLRNLMQQGIGSTFLTGPLGLTTPAPTAVPQLGGA